MQMTDDMARIILLVGFAVVTPVGIYHRLRSRTDERLDRRQEGWLILLSLRPLALAGMVGLVAFLIAPSCYSLLGLVQAVPPGICRGDDRISQVLGEPQ